MERSHGKATRVTVVETFTQPPTRRNGTNGHAHKSTVLGRTRLAGASPTECLPTSSARVTKLVGDAREIPLEDGTVDLVVTSPPYWKKRDYGVEGQIGQESTPQEYVGAMVECLREWRRVLRPTGSVFLNVGDSFHRRSLAGIPGRLEAAANDDGWLIRNRIIWTKDRGMPEPAKNRLAGRYEYVIHLVPNDAYYYDLFGYSEAVGNGTNPGDVWSISPERNMGKHLAPFPAELVRRAILLGCPVAVCPTCGEPRRRIVERTRELDVSRVQARRAIELAQQAGLTDAHIAAIQATGVSDAGKALKTQNGTGRNSAAVRALAAEAKEALGGYFREFTFALRRTTGWTSCACGAPTIPGMVLDPFMGTGTTLRVARDMNRSAVGVDLERHSS
jgi:DNA modification methylase